MLNLFSGPEPLLTKRDGWLLAGLAAATAVGAVLELIGVSVLMPVLMVFTRPDALLTQPCIGPFLRAFAGGDACCRTEDCNLEKLALALCILAGGFAVFKNLFQLLLIRMQAAFVNRKCAELARRLFARSLSAPYAFHLRHGLNDFLHWKNRLKQLQQGCFYPMLTVVGEVPVLVLILILLCVLSPMLLGLLALFLLPVSLGLYAVFRKRNYTLGRESDRQEQGEQTVWMQALGRIKETILAGAQEHFVTVFDAASRRSHQLQTILFTLGQAPRLCMETLMVVSAMAVLAVLLGCGKTTGEIALLLALYLAAAFRLLPSLTRLHYNLTLIRQNRASLDSILNLLAAIPQEKTHCIRPIPPFTRELKVENLHFRYADGLPELFDGLSFTLPAHTSLALAGSTGCGKTTLADLLAGLLEPTAGTITVDGVNVADDPAGWRRQIAYVVQGAGASGGTIRENVAWGMDPAKTDEAKIWEALKLARMEEVVRSLPGGLDYEIGDAGQGLSGGQRQRIGIARALYRGAAVLILDEATSALDLETEQELLNSLAALKKNCTLIVISHRPETIAACDAVLHLQAGKRG